MKIDWNDVEEKAAKARYLAGRKDAVADLRLSIKDRQAQGDKSMFTLKISLMPAHIMQDFEEVRLADVADALGAFLAALEDYYEKEYEKTCGQLRDAVC